MTQEQKLVKFKDSLAQFIRFGVVGCSNTLICYIVYAGLVRLGMHYLLGNAIGFLVSVINAFYWNNRFVFKQRDKKRRNLWKALFKSFVSYSLVSLVLASVLLYLWVDVFNISPYLGQILNLFITIPLNFFMNKFWTFR